MSHTTLLGPSKNKYGTQVLNDIPKFTNYKPFQLENEVLHCVESEEKFSVQFYILFFYLRKSSNLIIKGKMGFKKLCFDLGIDIQSSLFFTGTIFDGKKNYMYMYRHT